MDGDSALGMVTSVLAMQTAIAKARMCGIAYVGVFSNTSETYKPAWVFFDNLGSGNEKYLAEAISHEAGHNLGLSHDGLGSTAYYSDHGSGATGWAPIMGVGYYKELTQWSKGEYVDANQTQDDLQGIQNYGGTLRIAAHGDAMAAATPLAIAGTSASGSGVVSTRADVDVFSFYTGGGTVSLLSGGLFEAEVRFLEAVLSAEVERQSHMLTGCTS